MRDQELKEVYSFIKELAFKAGEILKNKFRKINHLKFKKDNLRDIVTEADTLSESYIIEQLITNFPLVNIISEEKAPEEEIDSNSNYFVIDPLDGTTNYAHGYPHFAVSIAYIKGQEVLTGVVFDPVKNEMFHAIKNKGAYLNNLKINVSNCQNLISALTATGFPYNRKYPNNIDRFNKIINKVKGIRRDGSAALNLCYVACGRFDAYFELKLNPWDIAAGALILQEAGGKITDYAGKSFDLFIGEIVATNKIIHENFIQVLNS